jgi:hypothetical protein
MENEGLIFAELTSGGDERGRSFALPGSWLPDAFPVRDGHITTLLPGHIRGNHFHRIRREILIVMFEDRFSLHWDTGEGTPLHHRQFEGQGTVAVMVEPQSSHAIRNDGSVFLHIVGLSDAAYDPLVPDAVSRQVCDAETDTLRAP